jgi:Dolichyl-phosphate-mannose-protein mannosyltransferase
MALELAAAHAATVLAIVVVALPFGFRLSRWLNLLPDDFLESTVYAIGLSFITIEWVVFFLTLAGWLNRRAALFLFVVMAFTGGSEWRQLAQIARRAARVAKGSVAKWDGWTITVLLGVVLALGLLLAMAPLTGSDAMQYHFTAPLLELGHPARPLFSLMHSFLTGQNHLLIALGLALGSDRIALGLIYAGGVLSGVALFVLGRRMMPKRWAALAMVLYFLTPMVFWQMSTAGCPDIWMTFYTTIAVLALWRGLEPQNRRWLLVAGWFAGTAAAGKYTGWMVPVGIVAACLVETRSLPWGLYAGLVSMVSGCLPLIRNTVWTRDPFFPIFSRWLSPEVFNSYAWAATMSDARSTNFQRSISHLTSFPFLMVLRGDSYGVGQYFGPLVLAFTPFLFLLPWKNRKTRVLGVVWFVALLLNAFTSQTARFLLAIYPIALILVCAGFCLSQEKLLRPVHAACWATLGLFVLFGLGSDAIYAKSFLPVVLGSESERVFLEKMAPDYQIASFVNERLAGKSGRVMVFFRHLYYLRVPFENGNPNESWVLVPELYDRPGALLDFCREHNLRWVVKSPDYPPPLTRAFEQLEASGALQPQWQTDVETFTGKSRTLQERIKDRVVILRIRFPEKMPVSPSRSGASR